MKFYTNVLQRGNRLYVRGYDSGRAYKKAIDYSPYLFVPEDRPDTEPKYRTVAGNPVRKKYFQSIKQAKQYVDETDGSTHGLTLYPYVYLNDEFPGEVRYDPELVRVASVDIECDSEGSFPDIASADKEITAITVRCRGASVVFGCGEFSTANAMITYVRASSERDLLVRFLHVWEKLGPDVMTGWFIETFDVPYLVNRIRRVLGEGFVKKLSPWGFIDERTIDFNSQRSQSYNIGGISILDYYHLYRKFTFTNKESYRLDYIAQVELGEGKLDYSEYGSLNSLQKNDFQKFIEYNIRDAELVDRIDDKMKFLELVMAMAYDAKVNYVDVLSTIRPWDAIIHNYLLERGIVVPLGRGDDPGGSLVGGYVKEPRIGLSEWVVSLDLTSLYPKLIEQYNISNDTYVGRLDRFPAIDDQIDTADSDEKISEVFDNPLSGKTFPVPLSECSIAANGCLYRKDRQGFLGALMSKMYDDRKFFKAKMLESKRLLEQAKTDEERESLKKDVARYHNRQLARKIFSNAAYGMLSNEYCRWYSFDNSEAVTTSGQLTIKFTERVINEYLNRKLGTTGIDRVIAIDTDSVYVDMSGIVRKLGISDKNETIDSLDAFCKNDLLPYLEACYSKLRERMNAYQQKMVMKRETIADRAVFRGKKMYVLNALDSEGVRFTEPKLVAHGIEAVRSSTPHACREKIKKAFELLLKGDRPAFDSLLSGFKIEFKSAPPEEIAFPRGVHGIRKYVDARSIYASGTPLHVKGAIIYNAMIERLGLREKEPIHDGDKIKYLYLNVPNPTGDKVISFKDELPKEFDLEEYIDRDLQFTKAFVEPIDSIASLVGWGVEAACDRRATLANLVALSQQGE